MLLLLSQLAALASCLAATWVAYRVAAWLVVHRTLATLPTPKLGSVIGGHVDSLTDPRPHRTLLSWNQELGGLYLVRAFWAHTVVVSDPALVHLLMKQRSDWDKSPKTYGKVAPVLGGASLFTASTSSPYWRAVRKGIAPAFNMRSLRAGFQHIQSAAAEVAALLHELGPERVVDMDTLLMRQSLDVNGLVGFEFDFESLKTARRNFGIMGGVAAAGSGGNAGPEADDDDMLRTMSLSMQEVNQRWMNPLRPLAAFFPGKTGTEVRANMRLFGVFGERIRRLLRTIRERGPPAPEDVSVAAHLLRLEDPISGGFFSDTRLLPELATLFVAGTDTTGHTMAWTLYLVSKHPEVEAKLCEELQGRSLLATRENPTPRQVTFEDIGQLPYLTAVVKESMRLLPVSAGGTAIEFPHDIEIKGHTIPANTVIWVHLFSAQNSSLYWDEPEHFNPERFLQPGAEYWQPAGALSPDPPVNGKRAPGSSGGTEPLRFFPFSLGTRDCVGQSLARLNYTATLATLWGQFSFRLGGESARPGGVRDIISLTLQPENGLKMVATPR